MQVNGSAAAGQEACSSLPRRTWPRPRGARRWLLLTRWGWHSVGDVHQPREIDVDNTAPVVQIRAAGGSDFARSPPHLVPTPNWKFPAGKSDLRHRTEPVVLKAPFDSRRIVVTQ